MKLKHFLLFVLCVSLFNCETEPTDTPDPEKDAPAEETDNTLIKRIVETYENGEKYTLDFQYDGNKLISVFSNDGDKNDFTYENDLLTRVDQYFEGKLEGYVLLSYNSENTLTEYTEYLLDIEGVGKIAYRNELVYNSDNSTKRYIYKGDFENQNDLTFTQTISFMGNNIVSNIDSSDDFASTYTLDDKNGIYKNTYAIEILNLLNDTEFSIILLGNANNVTKLVDFYNGVTDTDTYTFTYNDSNYPIEAELLSSTTWGGGIVPDTKSIIEYFYE
ncbi:hypothetical protein MHTCC0001_03650 [Flavobacteriaceae bacterium MHTCC 0001]